MTRKLTKYFIVIITFLLATIIEEIAFEFIIPDFHNRNDPFFATLVGMGMVVIIYYPAYFFIDNMAKKFTKEYLKASKKVISGKNIYGLLIGMLIALLIMYCIFLNLWFNINVIYYISS